MSSPLPLTTSPTLDLIDWKTFTLDETERGNIWLTNKEEHWDNVWIKLSDDYWLEIQIIVDNYPGLTVKTVEVSEEDLADHINAVFGNNDSWFVRKMNIKGVEVDDQWHYVIVEEDEE